VTHSDCLVPLLLTLNITIVLIEVVGVITSAGAETTSSLLSAATYYFLSSPLALQKLQAEIRGAFRTKEEITLVSIHTLPYLLAVINEAYESIHPHPETSLG